MASSGLADHYGVFDLDRGAEETAIKKAYRKLVLKWHPDKHPADRDLAEVKIRQINDAYETLSNPFKRSQYDQQVAAFERKKQGVRLDTAGIKPRMAIPKEFMLSPMGHPAKFVRCVGSSLFVQSRADAKVEFKGFFDEARFSLWWIPEVNNMCRLRSQSSAGHAGGINFSFSLSRQITSSEVVLSGSEDKESSALIAVASPAFEGSFRFESAHFPGHYLAFKPPTHLRMVGGVVDESTAIDFVLVDYVQMFRFITMEEVLLPAVFNLGGSLDYVSLESVRNDTNIRVYFEKVVQRPVWTDEDFQIFFESRFDDFDYDATRSSVRLRSKQEQLANSLLSAKGPAEVAAAISKAGEDILTLLPMDSFTVLLDTLGPALPAGGDASAAVNHMDAQKKVLAAMPRVCERREASFRQLLAAHAQVTKVGGEQPEAKIAERRAETAKELGTLVSQQIKRNGVGDEFTFEVFSCLCDVQLDWRACGEEVAKAAAPLLQNRSLETLLPLLRSAIKAPSTALAEQIGSVMWELLPQAAPQFAADSLEVFASGGLRLEELPPILRRVQRLGAPFPSVAAAVATLGERGVEGDDMRACAAFLVGEPHAALEALPSATLLRLMVAATKSAAMAELTLDAVAAAVAVILPAYGMDDTSKLLLAAAKAKGGVSGTGVTSLYVRAAEVVAPRLRELSIVQLIKVVLAISKAPACRPLLEAAAVESKGRLSEIPPAHLVLLLQGLLPLGGSHRVLERILDSLVRTFEQGSYQENLLGPDLIIDRRRDLEAKGQLTADQLAKLAQTLAQSTSSNRAFWEALGIRLGEMPKSLTAAGHASLEAAFPRGRGPDFESKDRLLRVVAAAQSAKERGARDSTDMTTREKAYQRQRDYEKREAETKKRFDREHQEDEKERQRLRASLMQKNRKRSRSGSSSTTRDKKNKDRDKKKRSRSRERDRDRDRRRK